MTLRNVVPPLQDGVASRAYISWERDEVQGPTRRQGKPPARKQSPAVVYPFPNSEL